MGAKTAPRRSSAAAPAPTPAERLGRRAKVVVMAPRAGLLVQARRRRRQERLGLEARAAAAVKASLCPGDRSPSPSAPQSQPGIPEEPPPPGTAAPGPAPAEASAPPTAAHSECSGEGEGDAAAAESAAAMRRRLGRHLAAAARRSTRSQEPALRLLLGSSAETEEGGDAQRREGRQTREWAARILADRSEAAEADRKQRAAQALRASRRFQREVARIVNWGRWYDPSAPRVIAKRASRQRLDKAVAIIRNFASSVLRVNPDLIAMRRRYFFKAVRSCQRLWRRWRMSQMLGRERLLSRWERDEQQRSMKAASLPRPGEVLGLDNMQRELDRCSVPLPRADMQRLLDAELWNQRLRYSREFREWQRSSADQQFSTAAQGMDLVAARKVLFHADLRSTDQKVATGKVRGSSIRTRSIGGPSPARPPPAPPGIRSVQLAVLKDRAREEAQARHDQRVREIISSATTFARCAAEADEAENSQGLRSPRSVLARARWQALGRWMRRVRFLRNVTEAFGRPDPGQDDLSRSPAHGQRRGAARCWDAGDSPLQGAAAVQRSFRTATGQLRGDMRLASVHGGSVTPPDTPRAFTQLAQDAGVGPLWLAECEWVQPYPGQQGWCVQHNPGQALIVRGEPCFLVALAPGLPTPRAAAGSSPRSRVSPAAAWGRHRTRRSRTDGTGAVPQPLPWPGAEVGSAPRAVLARPSALCWLRGELQPSGASPAPASAQRRRHAPGPTLDPEHFIDPFGALQSAPPSTGASSGQLGRRSAGAAAPSPGPRSTPSPAVSATRNRMDTLLSASQVHGLAARTARSRRQASLRCGYSPPKRTGARRQRTPTAGCSSAGRTPLTRTPQHRAAAPATPTLGAPAFPLFGVSGLGVAFPAARSLGCSR
eukprot:TRINITY_DN13550_c0_g1_i2.p1 TRINITY_DN13550_c0_g1~~TRINITY_DN13550_c0_g1_i2.p1  ORF type:complete len:886 (+),score=198.53 TRINITY_DN13550_c0_g1_i2:78-2735(+)